MIPKYRGFNTVTKTMVDLHKITPFALNFAIDGIFIPFSDTIILMQFTGRLDRDGIEIYQDDIVQIGEGKFDCCGVGLVGGQGIHVVKYDAIRTCFTNTHTSNGLGEVFSNVKVLGNIHQHPELL